LRNSNDLHDLATDKNLGPALMTRTRYIRFCLGHLNQPLVYQRSMTCSLHQVGNTNNCYYLTNFLRIHLGVHSFEVHLMPVYTAVLKNSNWKRWSSDTRYQESSHGVFTARNETYKSKFAVFCGTNINSLLETEYVIGIIVLAEYSAKFSKYSSQINLLTFIHLKISLIVELAVSYSNCLIWIFFHKNKSGWPPLLQRLHTQG
jgi:hypothetical protein